MKNSIYPCIWFNQTAKVASEFYIETFGEGKITTSNSMLTSFELMGQKFLGINGGTEFSANPSVSYFVYCEGNHQKLEQLYEKLSEDGMILMPLGKYDWSEKYAWVQDRFGVSWQLDIDPINNAQKIVPAFLFVNEKSQKIKEAVAFYTNVFTESKVLMESSFPDSNDLLFAQFKLKNYIFNAMSGGKEKHQFDFSEGNSFFIECETQEEIDHYWTNFSNGGNESQCGWVQDKYGIWWQVIPKKLTEWMTNPELAPKISQAFYKMKKINLKILEEIAG